MISLVNHFQSLLKVFFYNNVMCITFFCLNPYICARKQNQINENIEKSQQKSKQQNNSVNKSENENLHLSNRQPTEQEKQIYKQKNIATVQAVDRQRIKFVIAFNRDERTERSTLKMAPFEQDPNIYAGRDSVSTGTWLGINVKTGIMVVLTNYDVYPFRAGKSRGKLVHSFLSTSQIPQIIHNSPSQIDQLLKLRLEQVLKESDKYPAFNLLVYNIRSDKIFYICTQLGMKEPAQLHSSTVYGLCNTDLNTIWPKTKYGCNLFEKILKEYENKDETSLIDALTTLMRDNKTFSKNLNDEASIFVQPFYSTLQNSQRMTKSTFIAIVKNIQKNHQSATQIRMRQITHEHKKEEVDIAGEPGKKHKSKKHFEGYDHGTETVVDYKFHL